MARDKGEAALCRVAVLSSWAARALPFRHSTGWPNRMTSSLFIHSLRAAPAAGCRNSRSLLPRMLPRMTSRPSTPRACPPRACLVRMILPFLRAMTPICSWLSLTACYCRAQYSICRALAVSTGMPHCYRAGAEQHPSSGPLPLAIPKPVSVPC